MSSMKRSTIIEMISLLFVVLFLYTAISKLLDYSVFTEQLGTSPVLEPMSGFIAWALPLTEIIVAILLFLPRTRLPGLYASFILMVAFTLYIGVILLFSKELPCSCGGILQELSWPQHLVLNFGLIGLSLWAIFLSRKGAARPPANNPSLTY
ncbi:MAG: hypothetical protein E6Q24_05085 [Chitinophagaceae bacterium]|nr:MAG: hypothetical protein E6Q24_05085 [Chitinophagaceae bacterium]